MLRESGQGMGLTGMARVDPVRIEVVGDDVVGLPAFVETVGSRPYATSRFPPLAAPCWRRA